METIKINKLDLRGNMLIVGIEGKEDHTMQTGWQGIEVGYIQNMVGEGGSVDVILDSTKPNPKGGFYYNIKEVDMKSAVKGEPTAQESMEAMASASNTAEPTDDRDAKITAAVILKGAVEIISAAIKAGDTVKDGKQFGEAICGAVDELTGAYALALSNVKAL